MWNRFIYWLFSKVVLKVYFNSQSKKSGFENMNKAFVDSNADIYYLPKSDFDYGLRRSKEIQKRLSRINSGLSDDELNKFIEALENALNGGRNPKLADIAFLIGEIKARQEIWIHEDLWFDILALKYIREDENPAVFDMEIHKQKVAQFQKDSEGGLYDFFYKMGLITFIPYLSKLEKDWDVYMDQSRAKIQAHRKMLERYQTSLTGQNL